MSAGTCRICACTKERACAGGCSWTDATQTLCTTCQKTSEIAGPIVQIVGLVLQRQTRKTAVTWDQLTVAEQQLVVMGCRGLLEGLAEILGEDAIAAGLELADLAHFLDKKFPEDTKDQDEPVSAVVMRLLEPHAGRRLILPGLGQ